MARDNQFWQYAWKEEGRLEPAISNLAQLEIATLVLPLQKDKDPNSPTLTTVSSNQTLRRA